MKSIDTWEIGAVYQTTEATCIPVAEFYRNDLFMCIDRTCEDTTDTITKYIVKFLHLRDSKMYTFAVRKPDQINFEKVI